MIAYPAVSSLSLDRIIAVSQLIVQLDSFLAAGWTVGFFYFWGSVDKGTRVFYDKFIATEIEARLRGIQSLISLRNIF